MLRRSITHARTAFPPFFFFTLFLSDVTSAELRAVPVGEAPPDLLPRHLLTATVFLTWSGQAVALDQVAAAVEAAWGEALVPIGLSREELFSTRYSSEAWWNKLTVPKIERCIVELPLPSLLLKMVKLVATEFHDGADWRAFRTPHPQCH
ncbi:hypothetical protein WJX72_004733 [[Myrmecia] bisecta]|uniref:Secreted protein n=1 Tax=[Myrmecia] bisecta TaxID=41462 RepID=A0AAW1PXI2_9CHLO